MKKLFIGFTIFLCVVAGALFAYNRLVDRVDGTDAPREVREAPDFTVEDAEGNPVRLSDMLGKPVVLNLWASWCPPCRNEMPEFEKVYQELGDEVQFMMVDWIDGFSETKARGEAFIAEAGYTFPVYYDVNQDAAEAFPTRGIPATWFINAQGEIVHEKVGALTEENLRDGIDLIR